MTPLMAPGRADHGDGAPRIHEGLRGRRGQPAEDIEEEVADAAHRIFHVVPEDPEEPHVADEVKPAAVEKHGGERGDTSWDPLR